MRHRGTRALGGALWKRLTPAGESFMEETEFDLGLAGLGRWPCGDNGRDRAGG